MPSVGMRRSTRVFGARVLRSGRRLWTTPGVGKDVKNNHGEWIELLDHSRDGGGDSIKRKDHGRQGSFTVPEQEVMEMDADDKVMETALEKVAQAVVVADKCGGRRWGIVYTRKRKKVDSNVYFPDARNKKRFSDDQRFGKQYFRKRWQKRGPEPSQEVNLVIESTVGNSGKIDVSISNDITFNSAGPNVQRRSGRHIQKRRSSLRSKWGRWPPSLGTRKTNGALASNLLNFRHSGSQLSPLAPRHEVRSSGQKCTSINLKQVKYAQERAKHKADPISCSANVLVVDSEKCYRVEGAIISLEVSAEKQWHLSIKRDGVDLYNLIAQKVMRPCGSNRITHAVFWNLDNDWKLEFPDRQEWFIFRDIYKKCWDCNAQGFTEFIPVPRVCEVPGYVSSSSAFAKPTSYISVKDDELSRALARMTSNYDMDSEDEEWLNKFNSELDTENVDRRLLSAEDFELVIDAFEKGCYCNPDEFSDEYTAPHLSIGLERRVLEAVHRFWIKKRKQKRSALVKIFQLYSRKRTQVIMNSVLRKKRSFKRQSSVTGRGKQRPLLQAMVAEQGAREQQNALAKVEEAKAAANRSEELAILKRQRAQQLMESADLATYKAMMALKIAESSEMARSPDSVGLFFLAK